jgi:hypothetical protein
MEMQIDSTRPVRLENPMSAGKTVAGRHYLHRTLLEQSEAELVDAVTAALMVLGASVEPAFNVVRVAADGSEVAFLNYPDFFENPFPALKESWRVDRATGETGYRTYEDSLNPPILHRKELLLPGDHPGRADYVALTEQAESIGLFDDPKRIGYRRQWEALVADAGYRIEGHALVPIGNLEGLSGEAADGDLALAEAGEGGVLSRDLVGLGGALDWEAARHRTAMVRYGFSAPVQTLARHGFLDGRYRLFDYGCGRGDDVRGLRENGLTASGWDPYFAPEEPIAAADIVNLGFVINVIEDFDERLVALTRAWSLAERLLVVSVMLANQNDPRGERFRDGVITQRGTFQRYYTQSEIKAYLEQALDEEPIPVAPGVLYVFRDKEAEQRFLVERYSRRSNRLRVPSTRPAPMPRERPARRDRAAERYDAYREPLERLWETWLRLGRTPEKSEVDDLLPLIEGFGSLGKALRFLADQKGQEGARPRWRRPSRRASPIWRSISRFSSSVGGVPTSIWTRDCSATSRRSSATTPPRWRRVARSSFGSPTPRRSPPPADRPRSMAWAGSIRASRCNCTADWSSSCRRSCGSMSAPRRCSTATSARRTW